MVSFRNSEIKRLSPLFFAMLWDIDLIFGMWMYNDKLQIKFTFRSGRMIFGRVMAFGLWNLAKYLVVTTLFHYDLIFMAGTFVSEYLVSLELYKIEFKNLIQTSKFKFSFQGLVPHHNIIFRINLLCNCCFENKICAF